MARPKGTTKTNARQERVSIPMTAEEKALLEQFAVMYTAEHPEFVDTRGTATVMRQILLNTANAYLNPGKPATNPGLGAALPGNEPQ